MSSNATISRLDQICKRIVPSKCFAKGWGDVENMKKLFRIRKIVADKEACNKLVDANHPITIGAEVETGSNYSVFDGHFESPMVRYLGDSIPAEAQTARFQLVLPKKWPHQKIKPICVHLAGTGDHFYWKRKLFLAKPLLRDAGIASIILENPFYGCRKPLDQYRSSLRNVSDIFIMGGCLILESIALFNWCTKMNFGPVGVTGISMGGHNAALSGASWNRPCSIIPCLSWTTASRSFTEGVMKESVPWDILESQYTSYGESDKTELRGMIHSPDDQEIFQAGQYFADELTKSSPINKTSDSNTTTVLESSKSQLVPVSNSKTEAFQFMRGIMDECTHLGNFSLPVDPELAFIVSAKHDAYVPTVGTIPLTKLWTGCTHRTVDTGHVAAILFKSDVFRKAITDSFELNANKYHGTSLKERTSESKSKSKSKNKSCEKQNKEKEMTL